MNNSVKIFTLIFISVCILFIIDKRMFNKELILLPYMVWKDYSEQLRNENWMKVLIANEIPRLWDKHITNIDRANLIRNWAHEQTVWGNKPIDPKLRIIVNNKAVRQMYTFFNTVNKGLDCGTYSVFLHKLYQLFGYESYVYDMGNKSQFLHSVVLVWVEDKSNKKLLIEDPSYNLTYMNSDNTPMDFFGLLQSIKEKKENKIIIKQDLGRGHKAICFPDDKCNLSGRKIEKRDDNGMIVLRDHFNTQIINDNLQSFLYYRYINYFEKTKSLNSIIKPIEIALLKIKLHSIIGLIR